MMYFNVMSNYSDRYFGDNKGQVSFFESVRVVIRNPEILDERLNVDVFLNSSIDRYSSRDGAV